MNNKFVILFILNFMIVKPQVDSLSNYFDSIQNYTEAASLFNEDEESDFYEVIEEILRNPINLNDADKLDLLRIPFLDLASADEIIIYRTDNSKFYSLNELHLVENLSNELVNLLKPLLSLENKTQVIISKPFLNFIKIRMRSISDIQSREGFINNNYLGSKPKIYNRVQASADKYFLNLTTEKDAGENSLTDFYSVSFSISDFLFFKKFILGDYNLQFGQGLALSKPYGTKKSSFSTISVIKNNRLFSEYTSTDEIKFFRGTAITTSLNNLSISMFYSNKFLSANIDEDGKITSFKMDGIYRTELDLQKKNSTNLQTFGGVLNFKSAFFRVGFLYTNFLFNKTFSKEYSPFIRDKNQFNFLSFDYSANFKNLLLTGEFSYNELSVASINSIFINISRQFRFLTSFRNYPSNYYNFFSNGFGEKSNTQNEVGFYTGFQISTNFGKFDIYFDQFSFPNKEENKFNYSGNELSLFYQYNFYKNLGLNFRYFIETKDDEIINQNQILTGRIKRQRVRTDLLYSVEKNISLKTRFEINLFEERESEINEKGFLVYQDVKINPFRNLALYGRFIVFKTESFNTRIYEFENDLIGTMSNKALYGNGYRWYLMLKYNLFEEFDISVKYTNTYRTDVNELGTGNQKINGNNENQISLQVDAQF